MNAEEARRVLGLSSAAHDPMELRRVYLSKLETCSPTDDPSGLERVREAFELLWAHESPRSSSVPPLAPSTAPPPAPPMPTTRELSTELLAAAALPPELRMATLRDILGRHPESAEAHASLARTLLQLGRAHEALDPARRAAHLAHADALIELAHADASLLSREDGELLRRFLKPLELARLFATHDPDFARLHALDALRVRDVLDFTALDVLQLAQAFALAGRGDFAHDVMVSYHEMTDVIGRPSGPAAPALGYFWEALFVPEPFPPAARRALFAGIGEIAAGEAPASLHAYANAQPIEALRAREHLRKHRKQLNAALGHHFVRGAANRRPPSKISEWWWLLAVATCVGARAMPRLYDKVSAAAEEILDATEVPDPTTSPDDWRDSNIPPKDPVAFERWATQPTGWSTPTRERLVAVACPGDRAEPQCERAMLFADVLEAGSCAGSRQQRQVFLASYASLLDASLHAALDVEVAQVCDAEAAEGAP